MRQCADRHPNDGQSQHPIATQLFDAMSINDRPRMLEGVNLLKRAKLKVLRRSVGSIVASHLCNEIRLSESNISLRSILFKRENHHRLKANIVSFRYLTH